MMSPRASRLPKPPIRGTRSSLLDTPLAVPSLPSAPGYIRRAGHPADIYPFGSPRAGNSSFAKLITDQAGAQYRVTLANEPVARLPPIIFNNRHASPEYWLQNTNPTLADVKVCTGHANIDCNAGTDGFDMSQHSLYFQQINGCGPEEGTPWRRAELSDDEIAKQLAEWQKEDVGFVAELKVEGAL